MLLAPVNSAAAGTVVKMTDKEVSIDVPSGWSYERNVSRGGVVHDLEMKGPADSDGNRPVADLDSGTWQKSSSSSDLSSEMEKEISNEESQPDHSVEVVEAPHNMTINGEKANDMTLRITTSGVKERERVVLVVSTKLQKSYTFRATDSDSHYDPHASDIQSMVSSIKVIEKSSKTLSNAAVLGIVVGVIVVAAIVGIGAAIVLRRKTPKPPAQ